MDGHKIADHSLIHDRMHGKTIHEDLHNKNIHSDMHFGYMSHNQHGFGHSTHANKHI